MELTRFQKCLLAALAGMLLLFSVPLAALRAHPGVPFEESLLKITEQENRMIYSGKAHGTPVTIAVTWLSSFETDVEFTIGNSLHDVCRVIYPTESLQTETGMTVGGIRVTKNGEPLFEGGYDRDQEYWYDAEGNWDPMVSTGCSPTGAGPWRDFEVTAPVAVRFAFGPDTAAHGHPALFGMAVFLSVLLAVNIVFHRTLFRWRHWAAKNPEPSEGYLTLERAGWVIMAVIIAGVYVAALTEIY